MRKQRYCVVHPLAGRYAIKGNHRLMLEIERLNESHINAIQKVSVEDEQLRFAGTAEEFLQDGSIQLISMSSSMMVQLLASSSWTLLTPKVINFVHLTGSV